MSGMAQLHDGSGSQAGGVVDEVDAAAATPDASRPSTPKRGGSDEQGAVAAWLWGVYREMVRARVFVSV